MILPKANLTMSADVHLKAREIDFVTRFALNWEHLRDIMGTFRIIEKQNGTKLKSKVATVTLQDGNVGEGEEIPYSKSKITEVDYEDIKLEKYSNGISIEAVTENGIVVKNMTDDEFLVELQNKVTGKFYQYLATGKLTGSYNSFQMALAMAKGSVVNRFKQMHRNITDVVGFVNIMDVYMYIGAANIVEQNEFGFRYLKNFMGFNTIFLLSDDEIPAGKIYATARENIVLYHVNPANADYAKLGLAFTTDGETNLIGIHMQGNYHTDVSETFALMGMTLFAEYIDAIAVISFTDSSSVTPPSVALSANGRTAVKKTA